MNLLASIPEFMRKVLAVVVAYSTTLLGAYMWLETKIAAAEKNAVVTMKELRQEDMSLLRSELKDIKDDVRSVKKILMERR